MLSVRHVGRTSLRSASQCPRLKSILHPGTFRVYAFSSKTSPHTRKSTTSTPVEPYNPGMTINHFKAVFQPPGPKLRQRRYQLRWDWHLRNFLLALIPPAALWGTAAFVEWRLGGDVEVYERMFGERDPITGKMGKIASKTDSQGESQSGGISLHAILEERLARLEEEVLSLKAEKSSIQEKRELNSRCVGEHDDKLSKAASISRSIARVGADKRNS